MHKKIFRSSFFSAFLVLSVTLTLILGILFDYFEEQIETELQSEAKYISHAIGKEGLLYFEGLDTEKRITVVDFDGTVLYDSKSDAEKLDNHEDREEIREAIETGVGKSARYSETLAEKTVYYAIRLNDCILRVSTQQYTVVTVLLNIVQPILAVMFLAVILCFVLSSRVAKSIIKPINSIDPEAPEKGAVYEELSPLIRKLAQQKRTIKKQLDEAVKRQEEFRLITENMREGFLLIDAETNLLTYNLAALKLLGIEKVGGGSVLALCRSKEFREVVEKVLVGENAIHTMLFEAKSYRLIANPVFENMNVIGAVIIIVDVTESENRERLRREFTANVSHELKTPLTSISGFAELMKNGGTPEEIVVDFSGVIYSEARRLINLVNDIIRISELDDRSIPFENESVDLYTLSGEIMKRLTPMAEKKKVTMNLLGESTFVSGAEKIIEEMIYNLCDNAIKYNKENGTVDVLINKTDTQITVTVSDTGIGIPTAEQTRIFERFYRVDKSHSKKEGGTGLGLAIVKHGAIYHGAEVKLKSTEGKGTTITIYFPK